jgi:hypothetical protein
MKDATNMYVFHVPCKIGDIAWGLRKRNGVPTPLKGKVSEIFFVGPEMKLCIVVAQVCRGTWGENVFATEDEAREAARRLHNEQP